MSGDAHKWESPRLANLTVKVRLDAIELVKSLSTTSLQHSPRRRQRSAWQILFSWSQCALHAIFLDRASTLLRGMWVPSVEPDIITYSTIVKGYCLEGDVDPAFHVLEEMKSDDKFAVDEIMYNSILDGCARQHRIDDALRIFDEMKCRYAY